MCGIAGFLNWYPVPPKPDLIDHMLYLIRHRGPDEYGVFSDNRVTMGNVRLGIIDLSTGQQPIGNEDQTIWIVFNGEIYNYLELMQELKAKGHQFRTACDTEVIVHLYEEYGVQCLERLNGQFAFAVWDMRQQQLFMARDRVGIRPLFYTETADALVFGSEIKSICVHPSVDCRLDPIALNQIFTFWTTLTPRTVFRNIYQIPPGHYLIAKDGQLNVQPYWSLEFPPERDIEDRDIGDILEAFDLLLADSVRLRLRADVPVAAYLSGGLDSTTTVDFMRRHTGRNPQTFSIRFAENAFDETTYQQQAQQFFQTEHHSIQCNIDDIIQSLTDVIWHTETPITRTAPVPLFLLSKLVRENGIKVVVTGEGADEILAGYNIFKETLIRQFWARQPESTIRPQLLNRLYPYLPHLNSGGGLRLFFGNHLTEVEDPIYSHILRWCASKGKQVFSQELKAMLVGYDAIADAHDQFMPTLDGLSALAKSQLLETSIFMSNYLLSSQGDRVSMAHSVEGRYPFLDHRLIEFCAKLPAKWKVRGLTEKYLLKRLMQDRLPETIVRRSKQPYRAPVAQLFANGQTSEVVDEMLSKEALQNTGYFDPKVVARLLAKARSDRPLAESEQMALIGMLSTQITHDLFVKRSHTRFSANALQGVYAEKPEKIVELHDTYIS